jgi:hypothetical protein
MAIGGSLARSEVTLRKDVLASNTLFNLARHYFHIRFTGQTEIGAFSGKDVIKENSYFYVISGEQHRETMEAFFLNLAGDQNNEHYQRLRNEFKYYFKDYFLKYLKEDPILKTDPVKHREAELRADLAFEALRKAAEEFAQAYSVASGEGATKENIAKKDAAREKALQKLKILFQTLYPHWYQTRERSDAFEEWDIEAALGDGTPPSFLDKAKRFLGISTASTSSAAAA